MKIVSENRALLDHLHKELKIARVPVKKESKTVDGAMADEVTIAIEIVKEIKENYENIKFVVDGVIALGLYLKGEIQIEKKDGTFISYSEYEKLTAEQLKEIF